MSCPICHCLYMHSSREPVIPGDAPEGRTHVHTLKPHHVKQNDFYLVLYTSRVRKLAYLGISISVSISSPERLGNRLLKLASQSSPGLAGIVWKDGLWPWPWLVPGREVSAPTR